MKKIEAARGVRNGVSEKGQMKNEKMRGSVEAIDISD